MYFLMQCSHHPDMDNLRDQHRADHRQWVKSGGGGVAIVLIGSATINDQATSIGNFGILQAESLANATAFAEGDPFNRAGIVSDIEMTRLTDGFQAHRIPEPMSSS
ncbi:MAG: hypothetical protein COB24_13955 [Hyphomicrobiales bacterium]|nr:MAG: hypothetical protein COB24_13955 [Hyphomicrobiales bacterium]